jgi:hypothetical protein
MKARFLVLSVLVLAACDDKKEPDKTAASASAAMTASAPPATASTAAAPATASAMASAAPSASGASAQTSTKDPNVAVQDPVKEPAKTVKADLGSTVTLYLPKWAGTTWKVKDSSKPLGKAKEETFPGFQGPTPAAGFIWKLNDPTLKAGTSLKATIENTAKDQPAKTFTLTVDVI